ncbi:MAG: hypothetical protein ACYC4K_02855 [Thiobacillus sp.]
MGILNAAVRDTYDLAFQVSPIIFTGGEFTFPMPVIGLIGQLAALAQGAATGGVSIDDFYARYLPLPGGTVINNAIGTYPFANQQVAANAIIEQPKNISLMMVSPVRDVGGYLTKMAVFTALQTSFQNHNRSGGTYTILTPAFIYTDCIMPAMTDITGGDTKQQQVRWQLDFVKPLVSISDANAAFSNQLNMIAGGGKLTTSAPSGIAGVATSINNSLASAI